MKTVKDFGFQHSSDLTLKEPSSCCEDKIGRQVKDRNKPFWVIGNADLWPEPFFYFPNQHLEQFENNFWMHAKDHS